MNLFSSLRIIDLTRVFSGPFATRHFAEFGAEVIKVEPPQGDDSRNFSPLIGDWSGYFELLNHNKKSMFLDLKNRSDLSKLYELCKDCDVFVENFTPNVKTNLKIDYETIKKLNPKIIYASISGVSERVNRKYYDVIAQAESGLVSLNGETEDMKVATSVVDAFSGMKLAYAIASALYYREKSGRGSQLNVSMKGSAMDLLEQNLIEASVTKRNPGKVGNMDSAISPFGIFKTKDGSIVIAIGNEKLWGNFSDFLREKNPSFDRKLFVTNFLRVKNMDKLKLEIEKVAKTYTTKGFAKILNTLEIPNGQVKTMLDVLDDNENFQEGLLEKVHHPVAHDIVIPTGGIFFSGQKQEKYEIAPSKPK